MLLRDMAAILFQAVSSDWTALAGMLGLLIGISSVVGTLIAALVVRPMIDKAKNEILVAMVSKEVFQIYTEVDKQEHSDMKAQLIAIANRNHE